MTAFLRDPKNGEIYEYADKDAAAAVRAGWTPAAPAEVQAAEAAAASKAQAGSLGGKVQTALEAAGAGAFDAATGIPRLLSAGLSKVTGEVDPLARVSGRQFIEDVKGVGSELLSGGDVTAEAAARQYAAGARQRATENPITAAVGGIAGQVAGAAVGGLAGGARAAGAGLTGALGGGAAARLGGAALAGAIEGAPLALAGATDQAYIEHRMLTGEQALAAGGLGALFGGGLSFAGTGLAEGGAAVKQRILGDEGVRGFLRKFADERTVKALGATQRDVQRLGSTPAQVEKKIADMSDVVLNYKMPDGKPLFRSGATAEDLADRTAQAIKVEGKRIGDVYKQVDQAIASGEAQAPDLGRFFEQLDSEVMRPLVQSDSASIRARAQKVLDETGSLRNAMAEGEPVTIERLVKARQDLQSVIRPETPAQMGIPAPPPEHAAQLVRARQLLQGEIDATIEAAGFGAEYQAPKRLFENLKDANRIASRGSVRELGNRAVSPTDYLAGIGSGVAAAATGVSGLAAAMTGGVSTALHNVVRERGSSVLARAADSLATMALRSQKNIGSALDGMLTRGTSDAAETVFRLAAPRGLGQQATIPASLSYFMGKHATPEQAYEKRVNELYNLSQNMHGGVNDAIGNAFGPSASQEREALTAMTVSAVTGVNYLLSKMPGGLYRQNTLTPLTDKSYPNRGEIQSFARTYAAVMKPSTVLDDLKTAKATPDQIQAVKAVYPRYYEDIRSATLERIRALDQRGKSIPMRTRMMLDTLLDLNGAGERTMTTNFVQRYAPMMSDAAAMKSRQEEQQAKQRPRPGPTRLGKATTTQTATFLGGTGT